ncbi:MAG: UDP-N-acetylenolpyruvoylglucosamine reductase [Candidatus Levybacteria bacterium RIFCSPHIGHO2_01_FULL_40_10]|nr:MAG: UDP-N-acetylenolpyruvoylglucosamine reductase [Candidatus Levybacteria bacterium RIFCSPHIGHO2_01_FULL_40_10]
MKVHPQFDLKEILWYKIGGKTRFLIDVENKEDVKKAFEFLRKEKVKKTFFLGLGSNLIFTDDYFDGAVVRFVKGSNFVRLIKSNIIEADAGALLDDVIQFAFLNNLVGLEWAGGLPGDVGAAVRGNVGAFGGEIKDSIKEAEVFEIVGGKPRFKILKRFQLKFSYRSSIVKKKKIGITKAQFRLSPADAATLQRARQTYLSNMEYRKIRHPLEYPNCGSVFKNVANPEHVKKVLEVFPDLAEKIKRDWHGKVAMGYLIKRLDLPEYKVGNAMISPKHCNFIVNLGGARATDVLSIIKVVQDKFVETFDFLPEVEVEIIE